MIHPDPLLSLALIVMVVGAIIAMADIIGRIVFAVRAYGRQWRAEFKQRQQIRIARRYRKCLRKDVIKVAPSSLCARRPSIQ